MSCDDVHSNNEIVKLLEIVAENENIRDFEIKTTSGSEKGDGYVALITSAQIIGKNNENKPTNLNVIVKSAKKVDSLRETMPIHDIFDREIYVYDMIFPLYKELEIEHGINPTRIAPKFYLSENTEKSEAIVLENLKELGYRMFEDGAGLDEAHVSLVMKHYGKLHALSFALKDHRPEQFKKITEPMDDNFVKCIKEANFLNTFMYRFKKSLEALDPEADKEAIDVCRRFGDKIEDFYDVLPTLVNDYSVILHGDCWLNNMMFKYDDSNKPIQVDSLDFQVSRMGSPVLDLSGFFYSCSSTVSLDNHKYYMQLYYNSFSEHLRKLQCDPAKLFPYSILEKEWKSLARYGLIIAVVALHAMLSKKDETIDLADIVKSGGSVSEAFNYEISNIEAYNERVKPILLHFARNNLLDDFY